ncbi:MAG: hypothetical protein H0U13_02610 [Gemmatimonadaceae bacterium]|nr:hypothetical protein [Gemmatimonadaceae bacterium]
MPSAVRQGLLSGQETAADVRPGESRFRVFAEGVLRAVTLATLAFLIWHALRILDERRSARAGGVDIRQSLIEWSTREAPERVHVAFDSIPAPSIRDWIAALPGAGTRVSWEGVSLLPGALTVEPVVDPRHSTRIWVAAPGGSRIVIHDELGLLDSVTARGGGAMFTLPKVQGMVRADIGSAAGTTQAASGLRDSVSVKSVLVLGIVGWETKFVVASLEEHGWNVDAHLAIAPAGALIQGATTPRIDTARYAAVIALDTSAARFADRIIEYVRSGGGLIAAGYAASLPALAPILPASGTATVFGPGSFENDTASPRKALALVALRQLRPEALSIEMRGRSTAVAAHRVNSGRVLQVGYLDTWRWRMGGLNDPVKSYTMWWSGMVSSIAYSARTSWPLIPAAEPAPLAALIAALGTPIVLPAEVSRVLNDSRLLPALFALLMTTLLAEWASRRLRGEK